MEGDFLKFVLHLASVAVAALLIIDTVVEREDKVVLLLGQAHRCRVGKGNGVVALLVGMVIDHHAVHHSAFLVLLLDAKYVAVNAVVEGS